MDTFARQAARVAPVALVIACVVVLTQVAPQSALAFWPRFGRALTTAAGGQASPSIAPDGQGGAIVAWVDRRNPIVNIYAQRVLATGEVDPAWPTDGRILMTDPQALANASEPPAFPVIVSDGARGAIVAWQDGRSSATGSDVFAQHVLATGVVDRSWPANGTAVSVIAGIQDLPSIVADGTGGAIVTWMDGRPGATVVDVYAQHVLKSGLVDAAWPTNGVAVCTAAGAQAFPKIVQDGLGGAIVTWFDFRSSVTGTDIFAAHVLSSGVVDPAWPANGRALCTAAGSQSNPAIIPDGAHGAIVAWQDDRDGTSHIFAHHVLASGEVDSSWPANGLAVCLASIEQIEPILVADDAGGAIVAWKDARGGQAHNMFAQHVLEVGVVDATWPANGRALSLPATEQSQSCMVPDGGGGACVTWQESFDIFTQHVLASGVLDRAFPVSGLALCKLPSAQQTPAMTGAGTKAIVTWSDLRNGAGSDIYAMQVLAAASGNDVERTIANVK